MLFSETLSACCFFFWQTVHHAAFRSVSTTLYTVLLKAFGPVNSNGILLPLSILDDDSIRTAVSLGFPPFDPSVRKPTNLEVGTDASEWLRVRASLDVHLSDLGEIIELMKEGISKKNSYLCDRLGKLALQILSGCDKKNPQVWVEYLGDVSQMVRMWSILPPHIQSKICITSLDLISLHGDRAIPLLEDLFTSSRDFLGGADVLSFCRRMSICVNRVFGVDLKAPPTRDAYPLF